MSLALSKADAERLLQKGRLPPAARQAVAEWLGGAPASAPAAPAPAVVQARFAGHVAGYVKGHQEGERVACATLLPRIERLESLLRANPERNAHDPES